MPYIFGRKQASVYFDGIEVCFFLDTNTTIIVVQRRVGNAPGIYRLLTCLSVLLSIPGQRGKFEILEIRAYMRETGNRLVSQVVLIVVCFYEDGARMLSFSTSSLHKLSWHLEGDRTFKTKMTALLPIPFRQLILEKLFHNILSFFFRNDMLVVHFQSLRKAGESLWEKSIVYCCL